MNNTNKTALITGASRGLGKDMALALARAGKNVVITYATNKQEAEITAFEAAKYGVKSAVLQLDLNSLNSLNDFIQSLEVCLQNEIGVQRFDYLINNAGMGATVPFEKVTEESFTDFLNVHYKGVYFLTQKCLPLLNDGAGIVNISSGTTRFSNPGYSVYASMKGAVEVLTRYMAKELGARGIRANVVAPGPVETDFNNAAIRNNPQMKSVLSNLSPLGRVGEASDIGGVVAFLCSDDARWVNGQRLEVSGGINT